MSARLERVYEDLESGRVPGELEEPHDADDAEKLEDVVILFHVRQHVVQVERQRRHEVDNVHRRQRERQFARTDDRPCYQFEREPHVTDTLDVEEEKFFPQTISAVVMSFPQRTPGNVFSSKNSCGRHFFEERPMTFLPRRTHGDIPSSNNAW